MQPIIFNYYPADIKQSFPLGRVSLDYVLNAIKNPKRDMRETFEAIREAEERKDIATKQKLKEKLYSFTPCVLVAGPRAYSNICKFTGLLVLDFDHLDKSIVEEFKTYLFNTYNFIIATWLSASRHGVRAIVSIPTATSTDEFKQYFNGITEIMQAYNGFDPAPKNCTLPMFISYDPLLLSRQDATTFNRKVIPVVHPPMQQYVINDKYSSIEKIIQKRLNTISDAGHPVLRAAAYLLGGYIGAGYIDHDAAESMMNSMIDSHWYLSKKSHIYKQTAKTMIKKGILQPTYFNTI